MEPMLFIYVNDLLFLVKRVNNLAYNKATTFDNFL